MRRRTFDVLMSAGGIVITIVLLIGGTLAFWGYSFANDQVTDQLAAQRIFFPDADNEQLDDPLIGPYISRFAGQQLTTGEQAEAYANHYIAVHLGTADGMTYAEASAASRANPDDAELAAQVQTLFRGETLRGLLLNAYAFWKLGQLAKIAAFVAFALAAVLGLLTGLGFWHLRHVREEDEVLVHPHRAHPMAV